MRTTLLTLGIVTAISSVTPAQAPAPPLNDTRLTVHTLVREDVFAGFLQSDLQRLSRAEGNLEQLLASRPAERAAVLAWQGSTALTRAALAHEASQGEQFRQHYRRALDLFTEAMELGPDNIGVFAIAGGTQTAIADRLPLQERAAGWALGDMAYQRLWTLQQQVIEKLPLHMKGEVLAGLAQTAQRTGRADEANTHIERILALLPDTPYAARARHWKENPSTRAATTLTCQTCHAPGTLVARLADVSKIN